MRKIYHLFIILLLESNPNTFLPLIIDGISTNDCILYCTLQPCNECLKIICNSGIKTVYFDKFYDKAIFDQDVAQMLIISNVKVLHHNYPTNKIAYIRILFDGKEAWISLEYAEKIDSDDPQSGIKFKSAKLGADKINVGDAAKCTVTVSGEGTPSYKFAVYNNSGEKIYESDKYEKSNKISYTPEKAGIYYFSIDVKFDNGKSVKGYSKNFTVCNILKLKSVKGSVKETIINEKITWTVDAESYAEGANYYYSVYLDGELVSEKKSISSTLKYTPKKKGEYVAEVYLADEYSSSEKIVSDAVTVEAPLTIKSVTLGADQYFLNQEILCTVKASGGEEKYSGKYLPTKER